MSTPTRTPTQRPSPHSGRMGWRADRDREPMTDVAAMEQATRTLEAAAAEIAARLQAGIRERAAARHASPKPETAPPPSVQQAVQPAPGRTPTTGGIA
ncbi:hypothetical protein [Streptomyces sp. NBC_00233]|uniref:hypothetical protein n=1 Tax=Streptomyces sp. NBC_00233 TaxID=2975686 RepID=UPI002257D77D|nr:hypothetical protein [Streptomyces sp. NBC_00233]MCX5232970.1 hypothetical protein [Streptomyces sp. NBC_00233]